MSGTSSEPESQRYEIRVLGHLDPRWSEWFDGLSLGLDNDGTTTLSGPIVDQAALHGVLHRLRDAGLTLVSITRVDPTRSTSTPAHPQPNQRSTT